jgi:hypothetical protein
MGALFSGIDLNELSSLLSNCNAGLVSGARFPVSLYTAFTGQKVRIFTIDIKICKLSSGRTRNSMLG